MTKSKKTAVKISKVVAVRFLTDSLKDLDASAKRLGLDRSEFIRWACASVGGARSTITPTVRKKILDAVSTAVANELEDI